MKTYDHHCPSVQIGDQTSRCNPGDKQGSGRQGGIAVSLSALMLALVLSGCGQKGPLFLPKPQFPPDGEATQPQEAR
ncbi:MAG: LPS translocon maturation chaperone LptM [Burkholderiaceae bacterium]